MYVRAFGRQIQEFVLHGTVLIKNKNNVGCKRSTCMPVAVLCTLSSGVDPGFSRMGFE